MALLGRWFGFGREELFDQAMRAYDRGDWEGAAERFEACLDDSDPGMTRLARFYMGESFAQLGRTLANRGNYEGAVLNLRRALDISPRYPDLHIALARIYARLDETGLRSREIDAALNINPNFTDAQFEKGLLLYDEGQMEEGILLMTAAIESDPTLDPRVFDKGLQAHAEGDYATARSFFLCAVANESNEGHLHLCLASNFHRERMFEEAAQEYRLAAEIMPRYADVHCRYGQVLLELGRHKEAADELRRATQINPRYVQAHAYLSVALLKSRQPDQARAEVEAALNLDPANPVALSAARRLMTA